MSKKSFLILLKAMLKKIQLYIIRSVERHRFYFLIVDISKKGKFTKEDKELIQTRCTELGLSHSALKNVRAAIYKKALIAVKSSGLVSAEKENDLNEIQDFLMIPENDIWREKKSLAYSRRIAEIKFGNIPTLPLQDIILQGGEVAYWCEPAKLLEERVVGRRYEGGTSGVSIRIAKGVSYRTGNHRGRLITDKALIPVSSGEFVITNKRVLFKGGAKGADVRLDKILGFNFADDGMIFTVGNRERPYVLQFNSEENIAIIKAILESVMQKFAA